MKKDVALTLLKQMKDANLKEEEIEYFTKFSEDVLELLSKINTEYWLRIMNILEDYSHKEQVELLSILKETKYLKDMLDYLEFMTREDFRFTLAGAKTIKNSEHRFLAKYVGDLLTNEFALEYGIALEGLKILENSKHDFNMMYVYEILTDPIALEYKIALEGAKIINDIEDYRIAREIRSILTAEDLLKYGLSLKSAKILGESKNFFHCKYAGRVLTDEVALKHNMALAGAKMIMESKYDFNAYYACEVLTNTTLLEHKIALDGAKIINEAKTEFNVFLGSTLLSNKEFIREGTAIKWAKFANTIIEDRHKKKILDSLAKQSIQEVINILIQIKKQQETKKNELLKQEKDYLTRLMLTLELTQEEDIDFLKLVKEKPHQ